MPDHLRAQCFPATATDVEVMCRRLAWDGRALTLSEPSARRLDVWADGYSAVPDVAVGDEVAMHWGRLCGRLQSEQVRALAESTNGQLRADKSAAGIRLALWRPGLAGALRYVPLALRAQSMQGQAGASRTA